MLTTVKLSGITCGACEKVISKRLKTISDIQEVQVKLADGETTIFASRPITNDEIVKALEGTHYETIN